MSPAERKRHLFEMLRHHGSHSLAYSCLQPRLDYFQNGGPGVIAYRQSLGVSVALGDPLCAPDEIGELADAFLRERRGAAFAQISPRTAETLRDMGMYVTPMGVECEVDVQTFHTRGRKKQDLRHYRNKAVQGGLVVREEPDTPAIRESLVPISDAWRLTKTVKTREIEFLARPLSLTPEPDVRLFVGYVEEQPSAFVLFDPIYKDGMCEGYSAVILRSNSTAPEGALDYIIMQAIEQFREEGMARLSLGLSPCYMVKDLAKAQEKTARPLLWAFSTLYSRGRVIYNCKSLSFHKSRYRPRQVPMYAACRGPVGLWAMLATLRACRVF
jgi:lysylphosphatidylglycerol synthetase-like protein (DUF2156 family)